MMKKIIILIVLLFSLFSCVSIKPAKDIDKAERRIITLNKGIQNQIERYPSLVDKAYTYTFYDTLKIPADSLVLERLYQNITYLDSLNKDYLKKSNYQTQVIDSLLTIDYSKKPIDADTIKFLENKIRFANSQLIKLNSEKDSIFNLYVLETTKKTEGHYEDSVFRVDYIFDKGVLSLNIKTKDKFEVVEKIRNDFTIKPKLHFWQDVKFYAFLIIILNAIYFLGKEIQLFLKTALKKLIILFRKIIFKI